MQDSPRFSNKALFPGSFDPFHRGHRSIVERALLLFGEVVVGVGKNPDKRYSQTAEERVRRIREEFRDEPRVTAMAYDGLTIDLARSLGIRFLVKGVRNVEDMRNELSQAHWNKLHGGIETVLLFAEPELEDVSSTKIREK